MIVMWMEFLFCFVVHEMDYCGLCVRGANEGQVDVTDNNTKIEQHVLMLLSLISLPLTLAHNLTDSQAEVKLVTSQRALHRQ